MIGAVAERSQHQAWTMRLGLAVLAAVSSAAIAFTPSASANGNITFSDSPGMAAPPATLGPYAMTAFGADPTANGASLSSIGGPAGPIGLSTALTKATTPSGGWNNWSNGYTGAVYFSPTAESVTLTLPAGTAALYLYLEGDTFGSNPFTVTAQDGAPGDTTSSGAVSATSPGGASYFGFYATGGQTIWTVKISAAENVGLGIGEFGIAQLPAGPVASSGSATGITSTSAQLAGTVNPGAVATSSYFEFGASSNYGQVAPSPASADGNGSEPVATSTGIAGLQPATTYHYRLVAVNAYGETAYGADETFTTLAAAPPTPVQMAAPVTAVETCSVPRLSHVSLSAAKAALTSAGCRVGKIKYEKRPKTTKGLAYGVILQSPGSGTKVPLESKVSVTVGWFRKPASHKHP